MATLVLIRHARVLEKGLCYGRFDPKTEDPSPYLSDLSTKLRAIREAALSQPVVLWSSPLRRCQEIASPLGTSLNLPVKTDERLAEISMGDWEGKLFSELEAEPIFNNWMKEWQTASPPGGECLSQLEARVSAWCMHLDPESLHIVAAHAGIIRALRVQLLGHSWEQAMSAPVPHLTPEIFRLESQLP